MRVLVIGAGGVGEAAVKIAARSKAFSAICVADVDEAKAQAVAAAATGGVEVASAQVDASSIASITALASDFKPDAILNACDPRFVEPIFDAAYAVGCTYLDMAMSLSRPHPDEPYGKTGVMLGDYQFAKAAEWEAKGLLALVGIGVEPGLSDIFAAYAQKHLFSRMDEVGVRDGANLTVEGYDFAPTFSIWTTIEECLNPPLIFEKDKGWYVTEPFSGGEIFDFPEGIGPLECVNVEHEEVALIPRWIDAGRVTFKYGLGEEFIGVLKTLHKLGLDSTKPIEVGKVSVAPRDVVAAALPDPAKLGPIMTGKTCAGTWVKGLSKEGAPREVYLYHVVDNAKTMAEWGSQAVVWQTAINPVIALELLASGTWAGTGVLGPEAFDPDPFMEALIAHGSPYGIREEQA
ncbi:MAG: saccharopine dehydrogenase NADP-binding domain-containing protein [Actinomycetota bacterium]|nr:saccharopine dehydrogenase NADP-binding domain-containing protein [Actinomycetota bacterium]MDA8207504.1 saccharopine dehydrogenase NADP-binding domain-containing protein [Actinomycetota bacterium]